MIIGLSEVSIAQYITRVDIITGMNFSIVIIFCIAQIIVLIIILSIRRFRNYVNLFLAAILVIILLKFLYYLVYFSGFIDKESSWLYSIRFLQAMPPAILWFYATAIISGSFFMRKRMLLHAIPLLVGFIFFIPLMLKSFFPDLISFSLVNYNKWFGLIFSEVTGLLFIVYSQAIFRSFYTFYGANKSLKACLFDFTNQHLTLLKMLSVMMNIYSLILISGGFIAFYANTIPTLFDYLDTGFLILLSYLMIFIMVSTPKVIHYKYSSIPKSHKLLKYEKSGLSRKEAIEDMKEMNNWMETEKPFLNSSLSLGDMIEKLHIPGHIISEVLNGLLNQNFYDYINNYRIEEFKKLANLKTNTNETNLNLAFKSGFNSKTTFNTAFKKFTKQTPSQFRSEI